MHKTGPLKTVVLPVLLLLLLLGLAGRFWVSELEYSFTGPTHITAGSTGVYLNASGTVFYLSADGEFLSNVDIGQTGLDSDPIDLRLLASGELLVAGQQPASLRRCLPGTWSCVAQEGEALAGVERQFKILPYQPAGHWLLTDARGDALWEWVEGQAALQERLPARTLAGPNGLALDGQGHLWIADTDNRRIVEVIPSQEGGWVTGREHSAVNELTVGDRFYPMMLEPTSDGRFWVIQASDFSRALSDLIVYEADKGAVAVVGLPEGSYATDIAILDDSVLVSDMEQFSVYRVDTATLEVSSFGDRRFLDHMAHFRSQHDLYGRLGILSLVTIVLTGVLMVVVAIKVTPREHRWSRAPDPFIDEKIADSVPDTKGIHWLQPNPKMRWFVKWYERAFYVLFALLCLCSGLLYAWSCRPSGGGMDETTPFGLALLTMCLLVAGFIPLIHFSAKAFRRKLGSDGEYVHLELENGRHLKAKPEQLAYNYRIVLFRQYSFPLMTNRRSSLYAKDEIVTWLAPMLKGAEKLSEWQLIKWQWKNRDPLLLAITGAIVFMILMVLIIELLF